MGSGSSKAEKQELKANRKQKGLARTTPPPVQGLQSLDSPLVVPPAKSPAHPRPGSRKATNEKRPDQTLQEDASSSKSLKHKEHSFLASVFRGHVRRRRKAPPIDGIDEEIINPMDDTDEEIVGSMDNVDGNVLKLGNAIEEETKSACLAAALEVFPDIDPEYLEKKCVKLRHDQGQVIDAILADSGSSKPYPKRTKSLKRKRGASGKIDETARARLKYDNENRVEASLDYTRLSRKLLAQDFPRATAKSISQLMSDNNNLLLRSYLALDQLDRERLAGRPTPGFEWKKSRTPAAFHYTPPNLDQTIRDVAAPDQKRALEELRDARKVLKAQEDERSSAKEKELEEAENFIKAQEDGTTAECGCCFGDFAMNRMVCCANPDEMHYFCVDCARRNAETAVGLTKHEFSCMSMDGCSAGFSHSQRALFLDDKIIAALDRIEAEAVLRMAGVENLENCPFCPFAAEYSPIEEDKEFRCANPECEIVSCRLCREETHVPKTCEEAAKDHGFSARRQIEEAMSAALIRKCNKCGTPFIKDQGCNKMTCSRCNNIQCYVCSASCNYSHFDDSSRGGKKGNCPLFEQSEDRHDREVREAEERTRQKVLNDNPDLNEEQLRVHAADASKKRKDKKADARRWRAGQARLRDRYRRLPVDFPPPFDLRIPLPVAQPAMPLPPQVAVQARHPLGQRLDQIQGDFPFPGLFDPRPLPPGLGVEESEALSMSLGGHLMGNLDDPLQHHNPYLHNPYYHENIMPPNAAAPAEAHHGQPQQPKAVAMPGTNHNAKAGIEHFRQPMNAAQTPIQGQQEPGSQHASRQHDQQAASQHQPRPNANPQNNPQPAGARSRAEHELIQARRDLQQLLAAQEQLSRQRVRAQQAQQRPNEPRQSMERSQMQVNSRDVQQLLAAQEQLSRQRVRAQQAQQRPNEPRQSMERNQMQVNSQAANNDQPGNRVSRWGLAPAVLGLNPQLGWGTAYQNNDMVQQNNRNMASAGRTRENPLELD